MSEFVNSDLIEPEVENELNQKLVRLKFDEYRDSRENSLKISREEQLDAACSMRLHKQNTKIKTIMKPYENRIADAEKSSKVKRLIEFDHSVACSIKSLAVKRIIK